MRYFCSDLHFFHKLVHWKYRNQFSSIEDMNNDIVVKWNKQVKSRDTVYIIGDVTFGKYEETKELISRLNGQKILIRGNHDERFRSETWINLGFHDVRDTLVIKKDSEKWILSHYPYSSAFKFYWHKLFSKRSEAGYYKLFLPYKGYKLIHGHHHDGPVYKFDQVNVAWDIHGKLINENEVEELFKLRDTKFKLFEMLKLIFW